MGQDRENGTVDYQGALDAAIARSALSRLPAPALAQLLGRGIRLDAKARAVLYRDGDRPLFGVLVHGTLRVFATSDDGREFTIFWAHPGDVIGPDLIVGGPVDLAAQAVSDTSFHVFPMELVTSLARSDVRVAWVLLEMISQRVRQAVGFIRMLAFMDLRERVAQRLVEIAFHEPAGSPLVARVTQQDLADSVGSPRTSVARVLADLRSEGLVRTVATGIQVLRPEKLAG
jgi:CRP-like cAMP-binding protein